MHDYIARRCVEIGQYIVDTGATVRQAAAKFGLSKSSVHKDMNERLPQVHAQLGLSVSAVLKYNKQVRHLRGGEATRCKYLGKRRRADA